MQERHETLRERAELAALRFELSLVKYELAEHKYRADQARVPAGSSDGGRWMDEGSASPGAPALDDGVYSPGDPSNPILTNAASQPPPRYAINLPDEDAAGGHGFRDHVGKSNADLRRAVEADKLDGLFATIYGVNPKGSFNDLPNANAYVNQVLNENAATVDAFASRSNEKPLVLEKHYRSPTGREAYRILGDRSGTVRVRDTFWVRVVLKQIGHGKGFRVQTAFPMNH